MRARPGKTACVLRGCGRWAHAVVGAVKADRRHADGRLLREALLGLRQSRVTRNETETMPVRVDDNLDEVRVVECTRGTLEG